MIARNQNCSFGITTLKLKLNQLLQFTCKYYILDKRVGNSYSDVKNILHKFLTSSNE